MFTLIHLTEFIRCSRLLSASLHSLMVLAILPRPDSVIIFFRNFASVSIFVSWALNSVFLRARSSSSSSTVFCSPFFFSRYLKAAVLFWAFFLSRFSTGEGPVGAVGGFFRWYFFFSVLHSGPSQLSRGH